MRSFSVTIQMKATKQYFPLILLAFHYFKNTFESRLSSEFFCFDMRNIGPYCVQTRNRDRLRQSDSNYLSKQPE